MRAWLNSSVEGSAIDTANPGSTTGEISVTETKTVLANTQVVFDFVLDISDKGVEGPGISPEVIWLNIEAVSRPGGDAVYGMLFGIRLLSWRQGSHI